VTSDSAAPPVPRIPPKYTVFPPIKPLSPFDVHTPPPFAKQRPDTGHSGSSSRAVPGVSLPTASSKFVPLKTPYSQESGLPQSPSKVSLASSSGSSTVRPDSIHSVSGPKGSPIMAPWTAEGELSRSPPKAVPWPGQSRTPSPESSARGSELESPSKKTDTKAVLNEPTTFGIPNKTLRAMFLDHPSVKRFNEMMDNDGPAPEELVYYPGVPASEYNKMSALWQATGSPFESSKAKGKKPQSLPQSASSYSLATVTPYSYHEHEVPHSAPLDLPHSFFSRRAAASSIKSLGSKSAASSPTSPDFPPSSSAGESWRPTSKESGATSTSGSHRSTGYASLGRSGGRKPKNKKSLRNLFKRSSSPDRPRIGPISHPIPIPMPQPSRDSEVPSPPQLPPRSDSAVTSVPLPIRLSPAAVQFTPRPGLPPFRPERPKEGVDLDLVAMRGKDYTKMVSYKGCWIPVEDSPPPNVKMEIKKSDGQLFEKFSHERYTVKKTEKGMELSDYVVGKDESVDDI
jgi:hypothetical protein